MFRKVNRGVLVPGTSNVSQRELGIQLLGKSNVLQSETEKLEPRTFQSSGHKSDS